MGDFVTPEPVRLTLADGQTIDVKKRLNHGEREDMYARWSPYVVPGEPRTLKRSEVRTAKVAAYLLGWSLTNDGKPVRMAPEPEMSGPDREATIRSLDPDRFSEIHDAIEAHEEAMAQEREAQKKILSGSPRAALMSPSPSAVTADSSGSVN